MNLRHTAYTDEISAVDLSIDTHVGSGGQVKNESHLTYRASIITSCNCITLIATFQS